VARRFGSGPRVVKYTGNSSQVDAHIGEKALVSKQDTDLLRKLYETKEEEGLDKFENAISKMHEFDSAVTQSEQLRNITKLIDKTNRELKADYKREHRY
jgi:hypothetical protein